MVRTIAATGVDGKAPDGELEWMLAHADEQKIDVNDITYVAEALGRFDVAARAAARAKAAKPDDPTAKALAASVAGYLGHPDVASAALHELEGVKGLNEWQLTSLRYALEQSISGQPDPDLGPSFEPLFGRPYKTKDGSAVATRLFEHDETVGKCLIGGALPEAYVRITIGAGKYDRIEVMEPRASKATADCLRGAVKAVAIPPESKPTTIVIKFTPPGK